MALKDLIPWNRGRDVTVRRAEAPSLVLFLRFIERWIAFSTKLFEGLIFLRLGFPIASLAAAPHGPTLKWPKRAKRSKLRQSCQASMIRISMFILPTAYSRSAVKNTQRQNTKTA